MNIQRNPLENNPFEGTAAPSQSMSFGDLVAPRTQAPKQEAAEQDGRATAALQVPAPPERIDQPLRPFTQRLAAFRAKGFGPYILPLIPVNTEYRVWNKTRKQYEMRIANGKNPCLWNGSSWENMTGWTRHRATDSGIDAMMTWPADTGIGLQTGELISFDVDIKVRSTATDPAAVNARALIADIERIVSAKVGVSVSELPRRSRATSSSSMLFARMAERIRRPPMSLRRGGEEHAIEFMGSGSQVVVSAKHADGGVQVTNLEDWHLTDLPLLTETDVDELLAEFKRAAEARGYEVNVKEPRAPNAALNEWRDPVVAEVMARKQDWLSDLLNLDVSAALPFRLTQRDFDRDLEEDLLLDTASIWDFGTRRPHDPITLICEFGEIDAAGAISFGGAPHYTPGEGEQYIVKEDVFDTVRRPTPREAATWLCRRLSDNDTFPEYIGPTDWKSISGAVAKAIGPTLDDFAFARVCEFAEWSELGGSPEDWSAEELDRSAMFLEALRLTKPERYQQLQEHWASRPAEPIAPAVVAETIQQAKAEQVQQERTRHNAVTAGIQIVTTKLDPSSIPVRRYVVEPRLLVGDVTMVVGEPGVSKSSLALLDALRIASGEVDILAGTGHERVHSSGAVIIYNAEDRLDDMRRRLIAAQTHYGINETQHPIILWSGVDGPTLIIMRRGEGKQDVLRRANGADFLESMIEQHRPVLVCLDPQISLTAGSKENANEDMNDLYQELANIAAKHATSIQVIHHTSKATRDHVGDMGAGRGGFAAAGKARAVYTLVNVTGKSEDEKSWGVTAADNLVRLDDAKMNHARRPRLPMVFRRESVAVGNGHGLPPSTAAALYEQSPRQMLEATGDFAPVLVPVNLDELRRLAKAPEVDSGLAQKIAAAVDLVMGGSDECKASEIIPIAGERLRTEGVTEAKTRQTLTPFITNALLGSGVAIERGGQIVRIVAVKPEDKNRNAPWVFRRSVEERKDA